MIICGIAGGIFGQAAVRAGYDYVVGDKMKSVKDYFFGDTSFKKASDPAPAAPSRSFGMPGMLPALAAG